MNDELTLMEAAREFGVSRDTLRRRALITGTLSFRRRLGKIVVRRADVEAAIYTPRKKAASG